MGEKRASFWFVVGVKGFLLLLFTEGRGASDIAKLIMSMSIQRILERSFSQFYFVENYCKFESFAARAYRANSVVCLSTSLLLTTRSFMIPNWYRHGS